MNNKTYKNWLLSFDDNDIAHLKIDKQDSPTNVLSIEVLEELNLILGEFRLTLPTGVIISSNKSSGFIAGADINEFLEITNTNEALVLVHRGQNIFSKLESLHCPTVCLIDGFCMGGGTELALACDYRIAINDTNTKIGLPEVKLGIHPAFGGVVRSIELFNPIKALDWMLTGRALNAKKAKAMGLVTYAVPARHGLRTAIQLIKNRPRFSQSFVDKLCNAPIIRQLIAQFIKKQLSKKANIKHYPAPFALIDLWSQFGGNRDQLMKQEAVSVSRLIQGDTVRNLIRVFFLQTTLKSQSRLKDYHPKRVHVIGAGIMGGDIAAWCALKGFEVTLEDRAPKYLENAIARAHKLFRRRTGSKAECHAAIDRLMPDIKGYGTSKADIVIEAIFENIEAKQELYARVEPLLKKGALLATNTSSIPLETLATGLKKPEKLFGLHFFNPVAKMPLVEIVKTEHTDSDTINKALHFTKKIGKLPLVVKSSPGFLVNRILVPYLLEAVILLNEGESAERIDQAALDFGMPMGPIELSDSVGLDICLSVANNLSSHYGFEVPDILNDLVSSKKLGLKTGSGFYQYKKSKPVKSDDFNHSDLDKIQQRLSLRLINEAYACLREGIVDDKDLLDAGIIFGTGFAPFTGGPIHYADNIGEANIHKLMLDLSTSIDSRFKPDSIIKH